MLIFAKYAYMLLATIFALPVILDPPTRHGATRALLSWQETAKSSPRCFPIRVDPPIVVFVNTSSPDSMHPFGPNLPHFGRSASPAAFCSAYLGETQLDFRTASPSLPSPLSAGKEDQIPLGQSEEGPSDPAGFATKLSSTRTFSELGLMVAAAVVAVGIAVLLVLALLKWLCPRRSKRIVRIAPRRKQRADTPPVIKAVPAIPHKRHLHAVFLANLEPPVQGGLEAVWRQANVGGPDQIPEGGGGEDDPFVLVEDGGPAEQVEVPDAGNGMD
ncbi:hypothetical protein FB45DRAFT_1056237 [Roridomyces roridus]|uniref:Uncharacterized protein n=1 Tax=Roridomyces roridus TaxID=1738132 RepID=A0AAD7FSQ7_9AGAR|nr:hypothetical protein FB45DRAFT_1056237 [Roridomyces roridus]